MNHNFTKKLGCIATLLLLLLLPFAGFTQTFRTVESGGYITAMTKDNLGNIYTTRYNSVSAKYDIVRYNQGATSSAVIYTGLNGAGFDYPYGLAVDSEGNVFVSKYNADNEITKLTYNSGTDTYSATPYITGLYSNALAIDADDNLYATEYDAGSGKYKLVRFAKGTTTGETVLYEMNWINGYTNCVSIVVAPNKDIYFNLPFGNVTDPDHGGVIKLSAADNYSTPTTISTGRYSTAIGLDQAGNLYVSEYNSASSIFVLNKYAGATGTPTILYNLGADDNLFSFGMAVFNDQNIYFATGSSATNVGGDFIQYYDNPITAATNVNQTEQTATSTKLNWTNGSGEKRVVFMSEVTTGTPSVADNATYTANTSYGVGTKDGSNGWSCVYNGTGSSVTVTNLLANHIYRVMVLDYNGNPGSEQYQTATAAGNPVNLDAFVLPVTWVNFDVQQQSGKYQWHWQLGVESQVAYYVPQYSFDGIHYQDAGKVSEKSSTLSYSFSKELDAQDLIYLRVEVVNNDGSKAYSEVKTLSGSNGSDGMIIYPNPVGGILHLTWPNTSAATLEISIYNVAGQKVLHQKVTKRNVITLQVSGLASGSYYLVAEDNKQRQIKSGKFLKK
ncbi:MAG TPA: T9SS type A sorting domain-containing protein [Arachidicoccus sp.]|nr:T9SS type A sorting domain-containing protein [Arachidicoccus sp.]